MDHPGLPGWPFKLGHCAAIATLGIGVKHPEEARRIARDDRESRDVLGHHGADADHRKGTDREPVLELTSATDTRRGASALPGPGGCRLTTEQR
jgi:hypothetical protein